MQNRNPEDAALDLFAYTLFELSAKTRPEEARF